MFRFFRQIRQRLLTDNKFSKYLLYAVGEILLVVIGILIALQVNNWNESKRKDYLFRDSMEQILLGLKSDVNELVSISKGLTNQIKLIDIVLIQPDTFSLIQRPFALHYIMWDYHGVKLNTETEYFIQNLTYNPENKQQKTLAKGLTDYVIRIKGFESDIDIDFNDILYQHGLPRALITPYNGQELVVTDSTFYTKDQMKTATELIHSIEVKNTLKTIKTKSQYDLASIVGLIQNSKSLIAEIKALYPEIGAMYN
jgi:hypothetical protein